jgi:hypothetical protein
MSDARDLRIQPTPAVNGPVPVQLVRHEAPVQPPIARPPAADPNATSATTGGNLRAAYAQFAVNEDTHDVIIRIHDAATHQIISETPSREVEAMAKYLSDYAATMRLRAAPASGPAN